jgi:hypothetical protein
MYFADMYILYIVCTGFYLTQIFGNFCYTINITSLSLCVAGEWVRVVVVKSDGCSSSQSTCLIYYIYIYVYMRAHTLCRSRLTMLSIA